LPARLKRRPSWWLKLAKWLKSLPDDGRKVFVQVVGDRWPEDLKEMGRVIDGPWFDEPPPYAAEWGSRAEVGDFLYVSGHTRIERVR